MGPKYVPPTIIQLVEALQIEIKALKKIIEGLAPESEVIVLTEAVNALDGQLDTLTTVTIPGIQNDVDNITDVTIPGINSALDDKEDVANKVTTIDNDSTNEQYPSAKCVYDTTKTLQHDIDNKADGYNVGHAAKMTAAIPYGECDSTSTATNFTVTVPGIRELTSGVCCLVRNGVITSASGCKLNVNGLGAKPIYSTLAGATAVTTAWNVSYTMLFVYDAGNTHVAGGCWMMYYGIDNNTNTIGYQVRTNSYSMPMTSVVYRYRLLFTSKDGSHFVPANNSTSTNATSSRTVCQDPIDPHGSIVYYGTTASVNQGSRPAVASLWQQYLVTLGYSFNRTGAALNLTSWDPVYVKAAPQSDGSAIIDSTTPYVQALPATNDGFIYIFLGVAISATQIELNINHPVYYNDGTAIRIWTGPVTP